MRFVDALKNDLLLHRRGRGRAATGSLACRAAATDVIRSVVRGSFSERLTRAESRPGRGADACPLEEAGAFRRHLGAASAHEKAVVASAL